MMPMDIIKKEEESMKFKLMSGNYILLIGLGTFHIRGQEKMRNILDYALRAGYRLIDTSVICGNELDIGLALKDLLPKYLLKREDIFITSKFCPTYRGPNAIDALKTSIQNLDCGYLDLYLMHSSRTFYSDISTETVILREKSWALLAEAVKHGLVRDIGVTNYTLKQLKELIANNYGIKPAVIQVEWHPYFYDFELKQLCEKEEILIQTSSSLGGLYHTDLINDKTVMEIANRLNKTGVQVLLRWAIQQKIGIIPEASSEQQIEDTINLNFVISDNDMNLLNSLNQRVTDDMGPTGIY